MERLEKLNIKAWALQRLILNPTFQNLSPKVKFILPGLIAKECQSVCEAKGVFFLEAYKIECGPRLERIDWAWQKNDKFPYMKWNKVKGEIVRVLNGKDVLNKVPQEVIQAQIRLTETCVLAIEEKVRIPNTKKQSWIKNPQGGWMRQPN